MAVFVIILICV